MNLSTQVFELSSNWIDPMELHALKKANSWKIEVANGEPKKTFRILSKHASLNGITRFGIITWLCFQVHKHAHAHTQTFIK